ncbi:MAG: hypothetical protein MRERC_3c032 [Mycoplasmataceae bacterium RC_NB112A]|nr:MAG: hypothetical protein MRERC_3c032 [Mycoplasmataceae bacterium RC_NB112A]
MEKLPKIPPLLRITSSGYQVYPISLAVNQRKFNEIHIDPHCFEGEQKKLVTPQLIYYFVLQLDNKDFIPEDSKKVENILPKRNHFLIKTSLTG